MSKWRFGCGAIISVVVPRGYDYCSVNVECGSTSYTGGVNQCDKCAENHPVSEPREDEGDMEWYDRQELEGEN